MAGGGGGRAHLWAGCLGGGHELNYRNKAAWKKKLKRRQWAVAAQEEYERMLKAVGGRLGDACLPRH
jgi:hypothetical protein